MEIKTNTVNQLSDETDGARVTTANWSETACKKMGNAHFVSQQVEYEYGMVPWDDPHILVTNLIC